MKGLMVFRNNLRVQHNAALQNIKGKVDSLDCVFIMEPHWLSPQSSTRAKHRDCYNHGIGPQRRRFLLESLCDLDKKLRERGSALEIHYGDFAESVASLIVARDYDVIAAADLPGVNEQRQLGALRQRFPNKEWIVSDDFYLLDRNEPVLTPIEFPQPFSAVRKALKHLVIEPQKELVGGLPRPTVLGDAFSHDSLACYVGSAKDNGKLDQRFQGGESYALKQLNYYLHERGLVRDYKKTRNQLDGWDFSSKMSAWLAQGCVSVRTLYHEVQRHEERYGENESTYWLRFELWWREYFQWYARHAGVSLFSLRGVKNINPLLTFYPEAFMAWREGETSCDFVNAFMKQLKQTGWMSNRGRQIVASYLVNELNVDWRYGAAYFERQLIDYDCASNWGNWQYLAGVGMDPRGRRRFSMEKQQANYDPHGKFVRFWLEGDKAYESAGVL